MHFSSHFDVVPMNLNDLIQFFILNRMIFYGFIVINIMLVVPRSCSQVLKQGN